MGAHVKRTDDCIEVLAHNCQIETSSDLFSIELASLLEEMQESYEDWNKNSPDRFIFDMLVRRSFTAVVDYWETILMIIAANIETEKDYELRMDMLGLTEHFLLQKELHSTIIYYSDIILKMILIPATVWRVGKPNVSVRKASVICMIKMLENNLIDPKKFHTSFRTLFDALKNCLDDDWVNDIRYAALILVKNIISHSAEEFEHDDFNLIYPELLKRLDDAQDQIRIETCKVLELFFNSVPNPWSSSLYEYTVK
jgi:dynein assembly factor 5